MSNKNGLLQYNILRYVFFRLKISHTTSCKSIFPAYLSECLQNAQMETSFLPLFEIRGPK